MRMKLLRLLRLAPLALLVAGVASAQTTGTIIGVVTDAQSGKPVAGALVVATSSSLQGEQTVVSDKGGAFRIQALPPGDYKLSAQFDGYKTAERSDLTVRLDKTIRANLALVPEAVQMEEQVVKTGIAPAINVGTAEAGAVVSREFTSNIPSSRGFQNVAIVAPTATFDLLGVSFAGATSNENNYILDGLSVNDTATGVLGSQILNNFVEEVDIKTGSFMPEYGFASGGIVNVVTKSGSNEFHGSVFANYQPGSLSPIPKGVGRAGEAISTARDYQNTKTFLADFGLEVGGPILKDKLWFFAGIAPNLNRSVDLQQIGTDADPATILKTTPFQNKIDEVQYVGKLTYLFNENNNASITGVYAPTKVSGIASAGTGALLPATGTNSAIYRESERLVADVIGRYTSKLLDKRLLVEAVAGWHRQENNALPVTVDGVDQAANGITQWNLTHSLQDFFGASALPAECSGANAGDCTTVGFTTGGRGAYDVKNIRNRFTGKLAGSYLFEAGGNHQLKAGLEIQRTDYVHDKTYGGNAFFVERLGSAFTNRNTAVVNANTVYLNRNRGYGILAADRQSYEPTPVLSTKAVSTSQAYFLQDSYSPIDGLTVNAGVRWEMQQMGLPGTEGTSSFNITDNIAPRVQVIYDWTKQGRSKLSANWGRFYENVPLQLADRAFGNEQGPSNLVENCANPATTADKTLVQTAPSNVCATVVNAFQSAALGTFTYGRTGAGATPVAPNLKGQYADMFGAGVEYEVMTDLAVGFDYTGRRLGSIIEDMSTDGDTYYVANPGTGKAFDTGGGVFFDPKSAVAVDPVTGIHYTTAFPKPVREYDGFTFSVRKNFSNHWQALASYTYSSLRGNYPGLFKADTGQLDPNLTAMFDLAELLSNQTGPLPQDIPHQFKVFGSYTFDFGPQFSVTAGGAFRAESGVPVNFLGSHPLYGDSEGTVLPRGSGGRTPFNTKVDLRGSMQYVVKPPYTVKLSVDVLNVFNDQSTLSVDQDWTFDAVAPAVDAQCSGRSAVSKSNKIAAALADCPALQYLKTTAGRPVTINENWGQATSYRAPLAVRFGLEFSF
jgi:hypothetical protein